MEKKESVITESIAFTDLLFLVFLVLKLCDVIGWSWWWVCAPLWIPLAIMVVVAVIAGIVVGIYGLYVCIYNWIQNRRK